MSSLETHLLVIVAALLIALIATLLWTTARRKKVLSSLIAHSRKQALEIQELTLEVSNLELDSVTGIPLRNTWEKQVNEILEYRSQEIIIIDLDGFKEVNDEFGHSVGDIILQIFARSLTSNLRKNDLIGRFGGDEFVVALSNKDDSTEISAESISAIFTRIEQEYVRNVATFFTRQGGTSPIVGFSYGFVHMKKRRRDLSAHVQRADEKMYISKKERKALVSTD